jgi:hypothetical protein
VGSNAATVWQTSHTAFRTILGLCPKVQSQDERGKIDQIRRFNSLLAWHVVQFVSQFLKQVSESDEAHDNEFLLTSLLPSVAASLCLGPPNLPVLSSRFALALQPIYILLQSLTASVTNVLFLVSG